MNSFIDIATNHENNSLEDLKINSDEAQSVYVKKGKIIGSKEYYVSDAALYATFIKMFKKNDFWIKSLAETIEILNKEFE